MHKTLCITNVERKTPKMHSVAKSQGASFITHPLSDKAQRALTDHREYKARRRTKDSWIERLQALIVIATCIPMGARTPKDSWLERLQERG